MLSSFLSGAFSNIIFLDNSAGFPPSSLVHSFRSIELSIKSRLLKNNNQFEVKKNFRHNLIKAYKSLKKEDKVLSREEVEELKKANTKYHAKGFEYFMIDDALRGYEEYPNLTILDTIAEKLLKSSKPSTK